MMIKGAKEMPMVSYLVLITVTFFPLLIAGCGSEDSLISNHPMFEGDACSLFVTDSIGSLMGDSCFAFGDISDIAQDRDGNIFAIDAIRCTILSFSNQGDFIGQISRKGSGAGEMLSPCYIGIAGNHSICLMDMNGWIVHDGHGVYTSSVVMPSHVQRFQPSGEDYFVGIQSELSRQGSSLTASKTVCRWHYTDPDSIVAEFYSKMFTIDKDEDFAMDLARVDLFPIQFAAGASRVYIAPDPQNLPLVNIYDNNGALLDSIQLPYPRIAKSDEEIAEEISYIEGLFGFTTTFEFSLGWEPYPLLPMISSLGIDQDNQLWIQRGFERNPYFDVFDPSGDYLYSTTLHGMEGSFGWRFFISPNGIAALPKKTEDYPRIYLLKQSTNNSV